MNDHELTTILRRGGDRSELPVDVAERVQADMHEELDRTLGSHDVTARRLAPSRRAHRSLVRVAAAVFLVAATAGLLLVQREPDVNDVSLSQEVPPPQPYLVACLEFIDSASIDQRPWHELLDNPVATIPPDYLATLATSIEHLLATSPEARTAAPQLEAAAVEARSADPDLGLIVRQLESAQDTLYAETLVSCLTTSNRSQSAD